MSELTARDIAHFGRRLRERREELRRSIHDRLAQSGRHDFTELAGRVRDVGEDSLAELLASTDLTLIDRDVNELRDIEAALGRIRHGTYGQCEDCGGEISRERLEAYPTAIRCMECQRRREIGYAGGPDQTPSL